MRIAYIFLPLMLFCSCRKETVSEKSRELQLYKITSGGKTVGAFDYDNKGRLINESQFMGCENELRKVIYLYSEGRLVVRKRKEKRLIIPVLPGPPGVEPCDESAAYLELTDTLEYDQDGRLKKIVSGNTFVEYIYDHADTISAAQKLRTDPRILIKQLWYDSAGNLVEEKEVSGNSNDVSGVPLGLYYGNSLVDLLRKKYRNKYDTKRNPLYDSTLWPFHGPNNIISRGMGDFAFEWKYVYNEYGFPIERIGGDGSKWIFHYR